MANTDKACLCRWLFWFPTGIKVMGPLTHKHKSALLAGGEKIFKTFFFLLICIQLWLNVPHSESGRQWEKEEWVYLA